MKIAKNLTDLIGNTPLLELVRYTKQTGSTATLLAKLEYFNPTGSVKDRAAYAMIEAAEKAGVLKPGNTIIEPTSGNTGIGLAMTCAIKGYKLTLCMPDTMSTERQKLLRAYGVNIVLTSGAEGMAGSIRKAEELKNETPESIILQQFNNPANPLVHYDTTAEEIWKDTDGLIDIFVAGVGTGGTISGVGKRLKELNPDIEIVAVEPADSPILTKGIAGPHKIQGIGANFIPKNYDPTTITHVIAITNEEAIHTSRQLAQHEGLLVGFSSGAAVAAATKLADKPENKGKVIVALLPDTGERYLSTVLYEDTPVL